MMRRSVSALALVVSASTAIAAQAPESDIYLAPLHRVRDSIVVGTPINVTGAVAYPGPWPR